eukprot:1734863-Pleurochrysis_carterae.AAC.9
MARAARIAQVFAEEDVARAGSQAGGLPGSLPGGELADAWAALHPNARAQFGGPSLGANLSTGLGSVDATSSRLGGFNPAAGACTCHSPRHDCPYPPTLCVHSPRMSRHKYALDSATFLFIPIRRRLAAGEHALDQHDYESLPCQS